MADSVANAAAVEGGFVDDDLGALDALVVAELAGQLQGGFVGFQAGTAEEGVGQARQLGELGGELFLAGHVVVVGAVDQLGQLVLQGGHQLGVVVAQRVDGDAAQAVEVDLARGVPDSAALAVRQRDRQATVGVHDVGRGGLLGGGAHSVLQIGNANSRRAV